MLINVDKTLFLTTQNNRLFFYKRYQQPINIKYYNFLKKEYINSIVNDKQP
jgi:hypothetical protein